MFRNRHKYQTQRTESLKYLRQLNTRFKAEKQKYIEELDRLADAELENLYSDVAKIKKAFYAKHPSSS